MTKAISISTIHVVVALVLAFAGESFGCSMSVLPEPPRSIVNPTMYIFVGEVEGYTEPVTDVTNFRGEAFGLKVKIVDAIHVPSNFNYPNVEIFMFRHGSDCFPEARTDVRTIPLGKRFWFAIYPSTMIAGTSRWNRAVRLETNVFSKFGVWKETPEYTVNATSEFDYRNGLKDLKEKTGQDPQFKDAIPELFDLVFIETSKDLLRLARAKTKADRLKVLERLLYSPYVNYFRLFQSEVGKPLTSEHNPFLLSSLGFPAERQYSRTKKYSKAEKKLIDQRIKLEKSGELKLW